ncbi:hypothetical protein ACFXEL_21270 [Streptomyces sp. NPDC059382]|uniref:hypothetical protein n=1 Tax=Streptomyces sp. NPDC059382 TaxID=3346816 RepID=UPI003673CB18
MTVEVDGQAGPGRGETGELLDDRTAASVVAAGPVGRKWTTVPVVPSSAIGVSPVAGTPCS